MCESVEWCAMIRRASERRRGITLLELLTVMCIMVVIMSMSIVAYQGMVRSVGINGATADLRTALTLARQYAITHRCRVYVIFKQDGNTARHIAVAQEGVHEGLNNEPYLSVSTPRWVDGEMVNGKVFNLTSGDTMVITTNTTMSLQGTLSGGGKWDTGDRYGWAIRDEIDLPDGVVFNNGASNNVPEAVVYKSDGTTEKPPGQNYQIDLKELRGVASKKIVVAGTSGAITVQ